MQKKNAKSIKINTMLTSISSLCLMAVLCFSLTACGPSEEKIIQAQQKFAELTQANDAVVEAHKLISDASYDNDLVTLQKEAADLTAYNLEEMEDEEIDALIHTMDSLIKTYDNFLVTLTDVKAAEDAAVLVTIPVTLINNTSLNFIELSLQEQGDTVAPVNVLDEENPFGPTQALTGLIIRRDVENTPWELILTDSNSEKWELPLDAGAFTKDGISLALTYDSETETIKVSEYIPAFEETASPEADAETDTNTNADTEASESTDVASSEDTTEQSEEE